MSLKPGLQKAAEWVKEMSSGAKDAAEVALESGLLQDTLIDLCKVGGVAGALFKLGAMVIPDATPEQRIASTLSRALLDAFDTELTRDDGTITKATWDSYMRGERMETVTAKRLSNEFTWLSIYGNTGLKPSRSWPVVNELADVARAWVAEMAVLDDRPDAEAQQRADDARGRVHKSLCFAVDKLIADPQIRQDLDVSAELISREALDIMAEKLSLLDKYRLFDEVPQSELFVAPTAKLADMRESAAAIDWDKIEPQKRADDVLFSAISEGEPRLVVIEGEMGVGKSCLMRVLASRLAKQFTRDQSRPVVFARWRDIYSAPDLLKAIGDHVGSEHAVPLRLEDEQRLVYLIDGFDEMATHEEGKVTQYFHGLAQVVHNKQCTVVVAMRSTVVTGGLRLAWKNNEALIVRVQEFGNTEIDTWAGKWCDYTGARGITGEKLRSLCGQGSDGAAGLARNPLLLYMLAKHVVPKAAACEGILTRSSVFRTFVDETINGKVRASREDYPLHFDARYYRLLLQELAYIASWPAHDTKCPIGVVRKFHGKSILEDLRFEDARTAFVLHFFEPGNLAENEFEFQPEGFRQYLLAEWCVRAQFDALLNEYGGSGPFSRMRAEATQALAQFPLVADERTLLNEIYEEIGHLASEDQTGLAGHLSAYGIKCEVADADRRVTELYTRVQSHSEAPPAEEWKDMSLQIGVPQGQEVPDGLQSVRLLVNYWDQCLIALLGLYRGLRKDPKTENVFPKSHAALFQYFSLRQAVRGNQWAPDIDLSRLGLQEAHLPNMPLNQADVSESNLHGANLVRTVLCDAELTRADFSQALLALADLRYCSAFKTCFVDALMCDADIRRSELSTADMSGADLCNANLFKARITKKQLASARRKPLVSPDGTVSDNDSETGQLKLTGADADE